MIVLGRGVVDWVGRRLGASFAPEAQGIGWQDDEGFVAGAVFTNYSAGVDVHMHIYADYLSPTFMAVIMDYPFNQLKVRRITGPIAADNETSKEFARHLGAAHEGTLRAAAKDGGDVCIFGLLRSDAEKWLSRPFQRRLGVAHGRSHWRSARQESAVCATSA